MDSFINLGIMVIIIFAIIAIVLMTLLECYNRVENVNEVSVNKSRNNIKSLNNIKRNK